MYRRAFLAAATAAGASLAAPAAAQQRRLGFADVDRMNAKLAAVVSMDDRYGGTPDLEKHAAALAQEALRLQQGNAASTRVRSELYAVAAALTTSAMWAAIDGRRMDTAQAHMHQAVTLAGLAKNPAIQYRVWGHASSLYRQLGRHTDALAAAELARESPIARRDPLYASLALARLAVHYADTGDARSALRTLGKAEESYTRIDPAGQRPPWMRFYDRAELDSLALFTNLRLGRWADAEHRGHQCLARLRPDLHRNRALTHANLALAQIGQGEVEPAVASARAVPAEMASHGRVGKLLGDFTRRLNTLAPKSEPAREWAAHRKALAA
ncbi:tetratricopeptide repeat protein [Streptomyces mangrovi]|uniref:Tat pathway signal protein n=1 Tax=Streptomyces mangrovi TaxID=1206892 RepID=UPI00399CDD53